MSFEQLSHVSNLVSPDLRCNLLVSEWERKRLQLLVHIQDLPRLVEEYKGVQKTPYDGNPSITLMDQTPRIRLSSACESAAHCLYAMAEIAAQYASRVSNGIFPASFNAIRNKSEEGYYDDTALKEWVSDFTLYKKVREIRTEWSHHSTVFIAEDAGEPIACVNCLRRPSDRQEFLESIQVPIPELIEWILHAITTIDGFGNYLLVHHLIPRLDLDATFRNAKRDANGFPIITANHRFDTEEITTREYLARVGILVPK